MQREKLKRVLERGSIPLNEWGIGEAKTFDHLLEEVQSGEAELLIHEGKLLRSVEGTVVMVYYTDGTRTWKLHEEKQVFKDGREKRRDLESSIGEKMLPGEAPADAAYRALREELKITQLLHLTPKPDMIKGPIPSQSFPGILTRYFMYVFEVFLPKPLYKPEGYIEEQEDKTNYYTWKEIHPVRHNMNVLRPNFEKRDGLVSVVVQEFGTNKVLMLAYTNEAGYLETLATGNAVYWSTSRNERWCKGETSGDFQRVRDILIDCDGDALVYVVFQQGDGACHTKAHSCFYRNVHADDPMLMPAPKAGEKETLPVIEAPVETGLAVNLAEGHDWE